MAQKAYFTPPEAARKLQYSMKYLYDLLYSGRLPAEKNAGRWRIAAEAVDAQWRKRKGHR